MTQERKHSGSVFFPLPDGTGILYSLVGTSEPPKYTAIITEEVFCKIKFTKVIPIKNWLNKIQRFTVIVDSLKPDKLDSSVEINCLDFVDVPPKKTVDFHFSFYAYKDCSCTFKLTFKNEKSSEYVMYLVTFKASQKAENILESISLTCPVRQSVTHKIRLHNPFHYPVTFSTECKSPDIFIPLQINVPAKDKQNLHLEYQPVKAGPQVGKLIVYNSELGFYNYELKLNALPASSEPVQVFKTSLGHQQVVSVKFNHIGRSKTDYQCKIDSSDWLCERVVTASAATGGVGTETFLDVVYEPTKFGQHEGTLIISSQTGGEYIVPLKGTCLKPKPQGPYA